MRYTSEIIKGTNYKSNEIEYFLMECSIDYIYFAEHVLGFEIANYHIRWYELLEKFPRLCLEAFRGSGKTNFIAGFFLWKAVFKGNLNFLILSSTFEQSKLVLKIIRNMIMDNELLKQYSPNDRSLSWKATEITTINNCTFYSKTYGESVRGLRIDYVLCDEVDDYEDTSLYWSAVSPVVQLNRGRMIAIGTRKSTVGLLSELENNDEYWCDKFPAEVDGKPLWPQKYTMANKDDFGKRSLPAIRREIGELAYMQEFMLIPISAANSMFPYEMTSKACTNDSFIKFGRIYDTYYVGADLAISDQGDYTVFTVIKANSDGIWIVYADRFRGGFDEQKARLKIIYDNFKPTKVVMDKTGLGEMIFRELSKMFSGIEPVHFTSDEKYKLIMDLRHEFENQRISIPYSKEDIQTYNYTKNLLTELNEFSAAVSEKTKKLIFKSGKYDDTVISLALAVRAAQNSTGEVSLRFI